MEKAYLAGGCFWCIEEAYIDVEGILSTLCGYMGGESKNPTYEEVCTGKTGHKEVVEIQYDPDRITYMQILDIFWRHIDPFDNGGQFADRGKQYVTVIYFENMAQKQCAERSKHAVETLFNKPVATQILDASPFYQAEVDHQLYCKRNPVHFFQYQQSHVGHLQTLWAGKVIPLDPKEILTPLQYKVTKREGTEPPFKNAYWNKHEKGIYVDRISGTALFTSKDKYDSGTGWPSFTRVIDKQNVIENVDTSLLYTRIEVRGKQSGAHLGHVFPDGPYPTGIRYCINSAALRFVPIHKMAQEGYGNLLYLFESAEN